MKLDLPRRRIRYALFRIREGQDPGIEGLKEHIETQFKHNLQQNWNTFTFTWDVGIKNPLKVITKHEWKDEGGMYDQDGNRYPPAFTEQE